MSTLSKKITSAVAGLAIVFSMVTPIAGVSAAYTSLEAANELATLGVIVDQSANPADYRLGDTISREELSKVIAKLGGLAVVEGESVYADADFASWSEKYAKALNEAGYAASNTYFNPKSNTSKIEGLKWVMEARDIATGSGDDWMMARVDGAVSAGIASTFTDYNTSVTRGQIFIWAAEAIDATDEVATEEDPLCELLGICEEEETEEEVVEEEVTEEETPVVVPGSSTAMVSLSPESPTNGLAAVNTPRVAMLAFDVTAGSEDVTLEQLTLFHVGLGSRTNVDDVSVYNSNNENVSKKRSFSDNDLDISFDRDVVVQAGETQTFTVSATLSDNGATNTTYQVELTALEASTAVSGVGIRGAALTPTIVANAGLLSIDDDTASDDVTIGEEVKLAGFSIEEKNDNEDVLIRTITLHQNGSIDADYLEDLVLEADGEVIAANMMVNSDDELVMNVDYILASDDEVDFDLMGIVSGDVNETVHFEFESTDDVYATGMSTGFNIGFTSGDEPQTADIATAKTVEGAEIDAVFDKSDVDETKVDVDDVLVGTLELTANSNDYEVTKITVTVGGTAGTSAIDDLYLGGQSFDSQSGTVYTFEDIILSQGVTEVLPLEFDVVDNVGLNGQDVTFDIKITEIEDDENNVTYTIGGANNTDVTDVLSTNAFDNQSIDIETASLELTQVKVNNRELVLANGVETILYEAKISVGDSDDITIEDFKLTKEAASTLSVDIDDIIDSATLNIGGSTYDADVESSSVDFRSVNHVVAAGSDNVRVIVTAVLQDDDSITSTETLIMELLSANISLEDSDNEDVTGASKVITTGTKDTTTTLREQGDFAIKVISEVDTDDNLENTILAGTDSVVLAEVELEAEYEDMDVETLEFFINSTTDFSETIDNVTLMDGSSVIADGAVVTFDATNNRTVIKFEDFIVEDASDLIEAELVADVTKFTGQWDEVSAEIGTIAVTLNTAVEVEGDDSNDTITANTSGTTTGETVSIVPTILVFSVQETISNGAARIKVTADSGNNTVGDSNETPEVTLTQLVISELSGTADSYRLYKEGAASTQTAAVNVAANQVVFNTGNFGSVDVTFDTSHTYVLVPTGTAGATYSPVLSGDVATYNVDTTPVTSSITNLDNDISLGSRSFDN